MRTIYIGLLLTSFFGFALFAYAAITWDSAGDSGIWYGPNNGSYTSDTATVNLSDDFAGYSCPKDIPPAPIYIPGGSDGGGGGGSVGSAP